MEGLYYEASAHDAVPLPVPATLTQSRRRTPCAAFPYRTIADFDLGVRYLQLLGVRYYAATSDAAEATPRPRTRRCTSSRTCPTSTACRPTGWTIYEVADSPTVVRRSRTSRSSRRPARGAEWQCDGKPSPPRAPGRRSRARPVGVPRRAVVQRPAALDRPLTDDGPKSWTARRCSTRARCRSGRCPTVKVSNIHTTDDRVEFDVSRTGVPGDGEDVVLPELGGRGRRRPVARDAQLHGRRARREARDADVRRPRRSSGWAGC